MTARDLQVARLFCFFSDRLLVIFMNYILIGMPGSGKSTLGVLLAKHLGYDFIDADLVIQNREGKLLKEIIDEKGTSGFIKIEESVGCSIETDRTVISTGGSAILGEKAMEHYSSIGKIIYLDVSLEDLTGRLSSDLRKRGVVMHDGQTLKDIFEERVPLYMKYADITVKESGRSMDDTLMHLLTVLDQ